MFIIFDATLIMRIICNVGVTNTFQPLVTLCKRAIFRAPHCPLPADHFVHALNGAVRAPRDRYCPMIRSPLRSHTRTLASRSPFSSRVHRSVVRATYFFFTINNNKQNGVAGRLQHENGGGRRRRELVGADNTSGDAVRDRRDHRGWPERPTDRYGTRTRDDENGSGHHATAAVRWPSPSQSPTRPSPQPPGFGGRSAHLRIRKRRATRALRRTPWESRSIQVPNFQ